MATLDRLIDKLFARKLDWKSIDIARALEQPHLLDLIREACLIESFLPLYTAKMNELFWDNEHATSMFTLEAYEAYGHYYVLRHYLDVIGYRPIEDWEILDIRKKGLDLSYTDPVQELVNFMGTELFAAEFFRDLGSMNPEPALKKLLPEFVAEEVSHSQCAFDLLEGMVQTDPRLNQHILQAAQAFRHVGTYVVPRVAPAKSDNLRIILAFNERIAQLTGTRASDALFDSNLSL